MQKHPDPISEVHKSNMQQITKAIAQLDSFTHNLEHKVDGLLKAQQSQFVSSYKVHMAKLKEEFDRLGLQLRDRDLKIQEYENQGKMAHLMKRVSFLEDQQRGMLGDLEKKKETIRELVLDNSIKSSEIKRLEEKIKQLLRQRASFGQRIERDASYESIPTFTTEIAHENSKDRLSKMMTQQKSLKLRSLHRRSQKSQLTINPQASETNRLHRQLSQLKKQNRQLLTFNSKFISQTTELQKFFIETVNEIKKNIAVRKQIKECSLEDFRKEDKLELLIKVLSNDEIIYKLYSSVFGRKENPFGEGLGYQRPVSLRNKMNLNVKRSVDYHFPSIKSARLS